jgi:hypothetical protein
MRHMHDSPIRATEEINGVRVGWMWGLGEGAEDAIRDLIARFPTLGSPTDPLVVGWSPWPQCPVFQCRRVGDDGESYRFLGVGESWWRVSRTQAEYDYVMALLIGDHAEDGRLVMTDRGLQLQESPDTDAAAYLDGLARSLIDASR